jgi:hypothetical protein
VLDTINQNVINVNEAKQIDYFRVVNGFDRNYFDRIGAEVILTQIEK